MCALARWPDAKGMERKKGGERKQPKDLVKTRLLRIHAVGFTFCNSPFDSMTPLLTSLHTNTNGELGLHNGPVYWKCCSPGTIKTYDAYKAPADLCCCGLMYLPYPHMHMYTLQMKRKEKRDGKQHTYVPYNKLERMTHFKVNHGQRCKALLSFNEGRNENLSLSRFKGSIKTHIKHLGG